MKKTSGVILFVLLLSASAAAQTRDLPAHPRRAEQPGGLEQRIADLGQQISREMSENQKRTIAVVEFVDLKGRVTDFGRFLAEELITRLYQTKKFKVIERQLLNKVITEQKLSLTGIIDQTSAQKLGRLLGVDAIASGTVTDLGRSLKINARLVDTGTAEIFAVASAEVEKDEAVSGLMGGKDSPSTDDPAKPTQAARKGQKISSQFFTFELQHCRKSGSSVICDLLLTNDDKDRSLNLYMEGTEMYDDIGNSYKTSHVQFGNARSFLTIMEGSGVSGTLVSGISTKGRVQFDNVAPQAKKISLLQIVGSCQGEAVKIQFRNLLFTE